MRWHVHFRGMKQHLPTPSEYNARPLTVPHAPLPAPARGHACVRKRFQTFADIIGIRLAMWENDKWNTFEVKRLASRMPNDETPLTWDTTLKPEHFMRFANHPNELSLGELQQYIGNVAIGSRPEYFYDTLI